MAGLPLSYKLGRPPPSDFNALRAWIADELAAVERSSLEPSVAGLRLKALAAAPARLYDGLTVRADGVNWNPGGGAGVYTYYGGAWNRLG
jgi:hypothetical protein